MRRERIGNWLLQKLGWGRGASADAVDTTSFSAAEALRSGNSQAQLQFLLRANGLMLDTQNGLTFDAELWENIKAEGVNLHDMCRPAKVGVFDPNPRRPVDFILSAFTQPPVVDMVRKFRGFDEDTAQRICFFFGRATLPTSLTKERASFLAQMIDLGPGVSGEAIAAALMLYSLRGETTQTDHFTKNISRMAEAIEEDQTNLRATEELGLSQLVRLWKFVKKTHNEEDRTELLTARAKRLRTRFSGFPLVGAEFHILPTTQVLPNFWQRLALVNMSAYQRGSYIPLSGEERDVIEIRMNPSFYPATIANWNLLRFLLPELNRCYFTLAINRADRDFSSQNKDDVELADLLHFLGSLVYAANFTEQPEAHDEIPFGERYFGQTIRVKNGVFSRKGHWGRLRGESGQLNIYTGCTEIFPRLAYYLSMGLAQPNILAHIRTCIDGSVLPEHVLKMPEEGIRYILAEIEDRIESNARLKKAREQGERFVKQITV